MATLKAPSEKAGNNAAPHANMRTLAKHALWRLHAAGRGLRGLGPAYCIACNQKSAAFLPYRKGKRELSPILRDVRIVGSDLDRFRCPRCGATDRERHLIAYLENLPIDLFHDKRIMHFAPEASLGRLISQHRPRRYVQADLSPADATIIRMDLTAIPVDTGSVDLVVANHVLEHISDDRLALREIHRVLSPGGYAILQTPFSPGLPATLEIAAVRTRAARKELYGQEDHVRLYGADIITRFESCGLTARIRTHEDLLPSLDPARHGVNAAEPLFLFMKPA